MTIHAPSAEPACPGDSDADRPTDRPDAAPNGAALKVRRVAFDDVPRATWDRLAALNPWATPFSSWAFQRAWWDAYGASAHDQTLVVTADDATVEHPIAIVPLMHRHEVEPGDDATASKIRHGDLGTLTVVAPTAKAVFFGASYHADYATILAAPADLPAVAAAVVDHLAAPDPTDPDHPAPWDVIDLRRLRCGDPVADALVTAFGRREAGDGWTLSLEREDVCPVVTIPAGIAFEDYLSTLEKKSRHEIRRKFRRAEAVGPIVLTQVPPDAANLEAFIDLHQSKWGPDGLFPPTPGGDASRVFIRRWFEESGPDGPVRLMFLSVGERRLAAGILVSGGDRQMFYNAGSDPEARELSPGVLLVGEVIRFSAEQGLTRFDFLRGNEPYKYEWGSVDEPIQRLLVARNASSAEAPG